MLSRIDAKVGIEKSSFRGAPIRRNFGELVGRRGLREEVNPYHRYPRPPTVVLVFY